MPASSAPSVAQQARQQALARYGVLDTAAEADFDDIVHAASAACGVPVSLVSLIDANADRQWFKAKTGIDQAETPLSQSICAHAIEQNDLFIIPDTSQDPRTATNPLVTGGPGIRFYAGMPLTTPDGINIGSLCVIDTTPRELTEAQKIVLKTLARQVMVQLELRLALKTQKLLAREVNHRLKNTLAVVSAIANQTLKDGADLATAREAFNARLVSLARAQDVMLTGNGQAAAITDVVQAALAPHAPAGTESTPRLRLSGPALPLDAQQTLSLSLALHELATNAIKYGALSTPQGHVEITWAAPLTHAQSASQPFSFSWSEHNGPPVTPPTRKGFGSQLIQRSLGQDFAGAVTTAYPPTGFTCTLTGFLATP